MPSSYTQSNRLNLQATGENINEWGNQLNVGVFSPIDFALDGVVTLPTSGAVTLTVANGATDQARGRVLNVTAPAPTTITIPSVPKLYVVRAATAQVSITNGSNLITLAAGFTGWVVTDGTAIWQVRTTDLGGARLNNVGAPTANTDAATKAYVDQTAFNMAAGSLPGQTGNAGKSLTTDGTTASWQGPFAKQSDEFVDVVDATYTLLAANVGKVHRFLNASGCVVTLPNSLPAGWNIVWSQLGAGQITFTPGSGATRRNRYSHTKSSGLYAEGALRVDENVTGTGAVYILAGDTAA